MPWCHPRFAPIVYILFFYALYMLLVLPITELLEFVLRAFLGIESRSHSQWSRWIYGFCLLTFLPCYATVFFISWRKHRAKPLFTPKWKNSNDLDEDDVLCTICYDIIVEPHTLRCQHSFCKKCIDQCLPLTRKCPSCQQWVYWSRKNKIFKEKVLRWVKEKQREDEYEEVMQLKKEMKPVKVGCMARFWPFIIPFFEVPEREHHRNRQIRLRPIRRAAIQPAPIHLNESLVVEVIDEIENVPVNTQISPVMPPDEESNPVEIITCDQNQQPVDVV
ncbi:RING-type E3 ubiquitin transferase [Caenorhabditis elegans]|uniref:RING-type E3 ubiquitin transferase n=1 Tax=Caenorhabditis elegans TaxID=6239 RepID=Q7YWU1_CAEEL|nr:RING-type domain-containing protein [Caenorhabditis elegans]CAE17940.2 RING-type domain-containing protein [Caenorhabditis elegans]|eukprot:NP_001022740.2 Uncharacterized protein CELE_T02C1.2 [Caenorhabditis elegans]